MSLIDATTLAVPREMTLAVPADGPSTADLNIALYRKMYLIRQAEQAICEYYHEDEMKTPMHMSMGSEAICAGVCEALAKDDQVMGSYRSHALYLSKTMDPVSFFAEMYGKETGCARGKAGSMHLASLEHGMVGSSAIVAAHIPVALGLAFANKYNDNGRMVAVFFGDGAVDEGVFWESINAACLYKLPILFVCENNGLAVHTENESRRGYQSLNEVISRFECEASEDDTTDPERIFDATRDAIESVQQTGRPAFLHFHYYRYLEHVGISEDFHEGYRPLETYHLWKKRDPLTLQQSKLESIGVRADQIRDVESDIDARIKKSIELAKQDPVSDVSETYEGVFQCAK